MQIPFKIFNKSNNKAVVLMIFGGFAFATMGALTHALGKRIDWIVIAFFRMFLTFIFITSILVKDRKFPFILNNSLLWFRSIVGSVAMLATFYALTKLPISDVAVVTETRPIWVALLAGMILGESTKSKIWISIILSLVGVLLIEKPFFEQRNYAVFAALLASVLGAVVMICLRILKEIESKRIVAHFSGTACIISLVCLLIFKKDILPGINFDFTTSIMLLGVGIFGTIGQLAMTKAFAIGEAPVVATAGFIKIGFSAVYDILIWNYVFQYSTILGIILILSSTILIFNSNIFNFSNKLRSVLRIVRFPYF
jgi:drug/metabolite transporter (DMT)-like permease